MTDTEPRVATSLDDIGEVITYEEIERPDGVTVRVPLRTLASQEIWDIRRSITWPEPPVKDFRKVGNDPVPVYNYQDDGFKKAMDDCNRQLALTMLVRSIGFTVPGETEADKIETLKSKLGQYAFDKLIGAVSAINHLSEEAIARRARSFRRKRDAEPAGNGKTGMEFKPVEFAEPG